MDLFVLYIALTLFIFGIFIGSFLNVLIDRLSTERPFIKERSECESCHHMLHPKDLIPLFSYLALRGRCRYCKEKIPSRLFLIELLTGVTFLGIGFTYLTISIPLMIYMLFVFCIFIVVFFADLQYGIIPNLMVLLLTVGSILYRSIYEPTTLLTAIISAIVVCAFFLALLLVTRGRGMGMGDVKFAFALGLLLSYPGILIGMYGAFLTGAAISLILILWGKKKLKKSTIPFGPFMVLGAAVALLYGTKIYDYVMRVLL